MEILGDGYVLGFQDLMEAGRDRAREQAKDCRIRSVVVWRRPRLRAPMTVADVAGLLGVSSTMVKRWCAAGRFVGARRASQGKGSPWVIPGTRGSDGVLRPELRQGRRGPLPRAASALGLERVPF